MVCDATFNGVPVIFSQHCRGVTLVNLGHGPMIVCRDADAFEESVVLPSLWHDAWCAFRDDIVCPEHVLGIWMDRMMRRVVRRAETTQTPVTTRIDDWTGIINQPTRHLMVDQSLPFDALAR